MNKTTLRQWIKLRRKLALQNGEDAGVVVSLGRQVRLLDVWRNARCPCVYVSLPGEAPTAALLDDCFARGLTVAVPRVAEDSLSLHTIRGREGLRPGVFGILEPPGDAPRCDPGDIDCLIVPGAAFDGTGGRLGWGRGFYDKLLARIPAVPRIGLALDWQVLPAVPLEPHDVRMHWIVTPTALLKTKN